jgi:1-acyl-sn-glycerol-3-phosphate acyltransferase
MASDPIERVALEKRAQTVITDVLGIPADEVVLAPPQSVPKTASGKIRRSAAKDLYESGHIGERHPTLRRQMLRLLLQGRLLQIRHLVKATGIILYGGWWWAMIAIAAALAWLAVMLLPRLEWRWAAVRAIARTVLSAIGAPITISGLERVPSGNAVLAFNHLSYADALVVAATVPGTPAFAAKKELAGQFFAGPFLRRLGTCFVERYAILDSIADVEALQNVAHAGRLLVFFPEGTFTRRSGLAGFYLGAFKIAAEAGLPVIPAAIRGTRSMLRNERWLPRLAQVSVEFADPIEPTGADFSSVVKLRDATRNAILVRCGEPDLGELTKPERLVRNS